MEAPAQSQFSRWWWRQQFTPNAWGLVVNPYYFARRGLYRGLAEFFPALHGRVLDVGCGRKPYRRLVPAAEYVGLELDTPELRGLGAADLYYSGGRFPVPDASFDAVICSQVLEHIFQPAEFLAEIRRVLRPGGKLLLTTPFAWDEHSQPYDFGRYSSFGLAHLLAESGFTTVAQRKTCPDARTLVQLTSGYVYKTLRTRHRPLNLLVQLALIAPVNVLGGLLAWVVPGNSDLFLDNIVLAEKSTGPVGDRAPRQEAT